MGRLGDAVRLFGRRERPQSLFDTLSETREPIVTIAASTRTRGTVEARILRAVSGGARGLLVLSGGDLVRRGLGAVPGGASLLPMDAFRTLELVRRLRESGQLPEGLPVWAVENPLVGRIEARVDRLARKIDAGAAAVLLQPPLLWERYEAWWEQVHARGLTSTPLVVGVPVVSSAAMLRFWFFLVGCGAGSAEARALLRDYRAAERDLDEEGFTAFKRQWSAGLIGRIRELPGSAGIHLMPISGTSDLLPVLSAAGLAPSERARDDVDRLSADLEERGVSVVHEPGLRDDGYVRSFRGALRSLERVVENEAGMPPFRTYWNRITYAQHFRMPIAYRPFLDAAGGTEGWELALDVHQLDRGPALEEALRSALRRREAGSTESEGGAVVGDWAPYSRSPVWQFNDAFWRHMRAYVGTHGRDYRDSISGSPDSDLELVRANARRFPGAGRRGPGRGPRRRAGLRGVRRLQRRLRPGVHRHRDPLRPSRAPGDGAALLRAGRRRAGVPRGGAGGAGRAAPGVPPRLRTDQSRGAHGAGTLPGADPARAHHLRRQQPCQRQARPDRRRVLRHRDPPLPARAAGRASL